MLFFTARKDLRLILRTYRNIPLHYVTRKPVKLLNYVPVAKFKKKISSQNRHKIKTFFTTVVWVLKINHEILQSGHGVLFLSNSRTFSEELSPFCFIITINVMLLWDFSLTLRTLNGNETTLKLQTKFSIWLRKCLHSKSCDLRYSKGNLNILLSSFIPFLTCKWIWPSLN